MQAHTGLDVLVVSAEEAEPRTGRRLELRSDE
jgi:hypothetical protein